MYCKSYGALVSLSQYEIKKLSSCWLVMMMKIVIVT